MYISVIHYLFVVCIERSRIQFMNVSVFRIFQCLFIYERVLLFCFRLTNPDLFLNTVQCLIKLQREFPFHVTLRSKPYQVFDYEYRLHVCPGICTKSNIFIIFLFLPDFMSFCN